MSSLGGARNRFCKRVIQDLPADLEAMECDDPLGILRHHVPRLIDGIARHKDTRQPAYAYRTSFSIPGSPPSSRLRSAGGNIPFHFAKNMVAGRTAQAFDNYARGKGAGSERGAPGHGAVEEIEVGVEAGPVPGVEPGIDGSAKDAYMRGHGGRDGGPADGWTNLNDPADWNAIEAFERDRRLTPGGNPPGISIFYERAPALFDDIAQQAECPASLRRTIVKEQTRVAVGKPTSQRKARDGVRWTDERAFDVYAWIKTRPLWPGDVGTDARPVRVSQGRAVQTHLAGEGEYHAGLSADARGRIRAGMIDLVQRQCNPASQMDAGWFVPMTICDHVPDGLNDPLNNHFHWLMGTRRARYKDDGSLEFEAKKVGVITREDWIDVMREDLARSTNTELAAIDADVRYHPGTLAAMGIDATAQRKLHGRRTVLERAGFSTELGLSNDIEGWRRAFAGAAKEHDANVAAVNRRFASAARHDAARGAEIEAAALRHEAAQIQILIDMSRSRAARTARFAPEYAAAATSPRATAGWLARGREAEDYLSRLDIELTLERDAVAELIGRAARREAEATASISRTAAPAIVATVASAERPPELIVTSRATEAHRAVDVIARAPLLVVAGPNGLLVERRDDPDNLVGEVDLAGAREQKRLVAIRAVQQRELAQVQAFARRHGAAALFDDDCDTHSAWFRGALLKWRDTPVMQRYVAEREARVEQERQAGVRERYARRTTRSATEDVDLDALPSLADVPFLGDLWADAQRSPEPRVSRDDPAVRNHSAGGLAKEPVQAGQFIAPSPAPVQPAPVRPSTARPSPAPRSPLPSSTRAVIWTEVERNHRDHVAWRAERRNKEVADGIARALTDRVGGDHAITPYAARLIEKVGMGFDPAGVASKISPAGATLAQRDAAEIGVLSRDPVFRAHIEATLRHEPTVARLVAAAPPATSGPDFLGRVAVHHDRIRFGSAATAVPGAQTVFRTPLEWAQATLAIVAERAMPLSRQDGLVGIHDSDVLRLSHYNYVGLLHPSIQHALDVQRRIQIEVEREILSRVRTGALKFEASIKQDRLSREVTTSVRLLGGTSEERTFIALRQFDGAFYFRSREAAAGLPADAPALRHGNAVVRAWLEARDEGAALAVIDMLARQVRDLGGLGGTSGMADIDARALGAMSKPTPVRAPHVKRRGRGPRTRLPSQPGRDDPSR